MSDNNDPCIADAARVIEWANERPRRRANAAFTAGPERQAAYWIEWAEDRLRGYFRDALSDRGITWLGEVDILYDKCFGREPQCRPGS